MNRYLAIGLMFGFALSAVPAPTQACSESMFNSGGALPFQTYLAPRPASVLVYAEHDRSSETTDDAIYAGLTGAGHNVLVVHDEQELSDAFSSIEFDVVIAGATHLDLVTRLGQQLQEMPALVAVVSRAERRTASLGRQVGEVLVEGASIGRYLRAINRSLSGRTP